jgi:GNAT superfamily N-acetyltransferase
VRSLPDHLVLRALTSADASACAEVTKATDATYLEWMPEGWRPARPEDERAHYEEAIAEPGRWSVGVFEASGNLVGHASLRQARDSDDAPIEGIGHLTELFVHPQRWRRGIAAKLLALAEEEMRSRGYTQGRLRTPIGAPAIEFYRSQGWAENGETLYLVQYDLDTIGFSKALDSEGA